MIQIKCHWYYSKENILATCFSQMSRHYVLWKCSFSLDPRICMEFGGGGMFVLLLSHDQTLLSYIAVKRCSFEKCKTETRPIKC